MKKLSIAVITILVLAFILASHAFVWVFATIVEYGFYALIIAFVLYLVWKVKNRKKDKEDKS